ncbi:7083_t:CDS:2 [Dentiscutata erythropus]|uniref:7083_t:CDS:1 n=1 Tax=Dentiscutata erythropus TaxID=1348616 RepID=A0A9N8Z9W0_9GLOM|nr:7083_t:CDS:2 [Dentiscutata erythropus]
MHPLIGHKKPHTARINLIYVTETILAYLKLVMISDRQFACLDHLILLKDDGQKLYRCVAAVKASVEVINMQSNLTSNINVLDKQMNCYIENTSLNVTDMDPWWG